MNTGSTFREELERLQNEGKIPHDVNVDNIKLVFMRRTFENDNLLMKFRGKTKYSLCSLFILPILCACGVFAHACRHWYKSWSVRIV